MSGADILLAEVRFGFEDWSVEFDLTLPAGCFAAVMGPSGSGKSTLLNLIAGFERPDAGRVLIGGQDVTASPPAMRPVSMIFQENNLFGHLDIWSNVGLGRSPRLKLGERDRDDIAQALRSTGLAGKEKRLPSQLSGGECPRVELVRALLRDRPVLLLDEAFSSLGPGLRNEMLDLTGDLHRAGNMTVLMVTHHPDDAARIADRIVLVDQGRIAAIGETAAMLAPGAPERMRRYLGESRALPG
jgi:thiamine transport system ATP-binding protein